MTPHIKPVDSDTTHKDILDEVSIEAIIEQLRPAYTQLIQADRHPNQRTLTARNYDSALKALSAFMADREANLPTKSVLAAWRDSMLQSGAAVSTVNARLSAARKLLRAVTDTMTDARIKMVLKDWATVENAKKFESADKDEIESVESEYGRCFTLESVNKLIHSIDTSNLKGLRDRALIAVMVGAGLKVSEVTKLTLQDVFDALNERGQRGIKVDHPNYNKTRVVVLSGWNSWVINALHAYTDSVGVFVHSTPYERVFRGVKILQRAQKDDKTRQGKLYCSKGDKITSRNVEIAISSYTIEWHEIEVKITCRDLRRTYAKICKEYGMSLEAIRANMGLRSLAFTEKYVGEVIEWSERVPMWTIAIDYMPPASYNQSDKV